MNPIQFIFCPPDEENREWQVIFRTTKDIRYVDDVKLSFCLDYFSDQESFMDDAYDAFGCSDTHFFYGFAIEYTPSQNVADHFMQLGASQLPNDESFFGSNFRRWQ